MLERVEKFLISWYYFCDKSFCEIEVSVSNVRCKNAESGFGYTGYRICDPFYDDDYFICKQHKKAQSLQRMYGYNRTHLETRISRGER